MRIRTVKPEFWHHEEMSELNAETALLALALLNYADDEGYFKWHPKLIESTLFPLRELSGSIQGMLTELSEVEFIDELNGSDGKKYGKISAFLTHQKVNKPTPSKIKPLIVGKSTYEDNSGSTHGKVKESSPTERKGKEQGTGKGKEEPSGSCPPESDDDDLVILAKPAWEILWNRSPEKARRRSSRKQVEDEWKRIKASDRPDLNVLTTAFDAWLTCEDWTKDQGDFVPGLHLWIKRRQWENPPTPEPKTRASESAEELMGGRSLSVVKASDLNLEPTSDDDIPFD